MKNGHPPVEDNSAVGAASRDTMRCGMRGILAALSVAVVMVSLVTSEAKADVRISVHYRGEEQPQTPPNSSFEFRDTDASNQQEYNMQQLLAALRRGDNFGVMLTSRSQSIDLEFAEGDVLAVSFVLADGTRYYVDDYTEISPSAIDLQLTGWAHNERSFDYVNLVQNLSGVAGFTAVDWRSSNNRRALTQTLAIVSYLVLAARAESIETLIINQFVSTSRITIHIGMVYLLRYWNVFYEWASQSARDVLEFFHERFHLGQFILFFRRYAVRPGRRIPPHEQVIYSFLFWTVGNCAPPA